MSKTSVIILIVAIILTLGQIGLMAFNRPLFCKIAMLGGVGQVPALCLADAVKQINQ